MSKGLRQQQHRPAREAVRGREIADLKRKNDQLARQNARLRKQIEKTVATEAVFRGDALIPEIVENAYQKTVPNHGTLQVEIAAPNQCPEPSCNGLMRRIDLGRVVLDICPVCKKRRHVV